MDEFRSDTIIVIDTPDIDIHNIFHLLDGDSD